MECLPSLAQADQASTRSLARLHRLHKVWRMRVCKNMYISQTLHVCHICRPIDPSNHPNVGKYASPMECLGIVCYVYRYVILCMYIYIYICYCYVFCRITFPQVASTSGNGSPTEKVDRFRRESLRTDAESVRTDRGLNVA